MFERSAEYYEDQAKRCEAAADAARDEGDAEHEKQLRARAIGYRRQARERAAGVGEPSYPLANAYPCYSHD